MQHMECDRKCAFPTAVHSVRLCSFVVVGINLAVPVYHIDKLSWQGVTIFVKIKTYPTMFERVLLYKICQICPLFLNMMRTGSPIDSECPMGVHSTNKFAKNDVMRELGLCSVFRLACLVSYILLYCSTTCILWRLFTTNAFRRLCWHRNPCCLL